MGEGHIRRLLQNLNDDAAVEAGLEEVRRANSDAYENALKQLTALQSEKKSSPKK